MAEGGCIVLYLYTVQCVQCTALYSHGDIEEDGEEELVVDGHGDEAALVELGGGLAHLDAQPDAPQQEQELH